MSVPVIVGVAVQVECDLCRGKPVEDRIELRACAKCGGTRKHMVLMELADFRALLEDTL